MGMLMHFLWLWMFAWSFICCFHMFRVFTGKTIRHNTCSIGNCCRMSPLLHTVTLSLVCPTSIVAIVIFTSLGISGGSRTGYGSDVCYLDSDLLVGRSFTLFCIFENFPPGIYSICNYISKRPSFGFSS